MSCQVANNKSVLQNYFIHFICCRKIEGYNENTFKEKSRESYGLTIFNPDVENLVHEKKKML